MQMTIPPFLYEYLPNVRVVNLGGATEASIWSCHFDARDNPFAKPDEDVFFSRAPIRYSFYPEVVQIPVLEQPISALLKRGDWLHRFVLSNFCS